MSASLTLLPLLALLAQPDARPEPAPPPSPPPGTEQPVPPPVDPDILEGRRRPGYVAPLPDAITQDNPGAVRAPPPQAFPTGEVPIPDRWRLITAFCPQKEFFKAVAETCHSPLDPYHQNTLKGDRPLNPDDVPFHLIHSNDWFFTLGVTSDSLFEPRTFPIPVGVQTTARPRSLDTFGHDASYVLAQTVLVGAALTKGSTAFKPPHVEYRLTLAFNVNYANVPERRILDVRPSEPSNRFDHFVGVQEAFVDYHLRDVSERYDFDSIRVGIQPFQADFRGFLFNDDQLGIRLFGNRDNNRFQYNLAAFWRLEKDTNSGLNAVLQTPRRDWLLVANVYRQDFLIPALTSQVTLAYNINREALRTEIDDNGFPVRPALIGNLRGRNYDIVYLGYNADGHIGRVNLTASAYGAVGEDRNSIFTGRPANVRAMFAAAELSYDHDWMRFRLSGAYASGDGDPYDDTESGYDAVFENPVFAGADTSYWIRQSIPFAGGGRQVFLNGRNGVLNDLRSSKEQGQSNFNNPGLMLAGIGGDFDVLPELRVSANANHLWFQDTATLQVLRNEGSIPRDIGWDLSGSAIWRPRASQNMVFRLSAAALVAGDGFRDLFTSTDRSDAYYSVLANAVVSY
jgi:hypothetical protein